MKESNPSDSLRGFTLRFSMPAPNAMQKRYQLSVGIVFLKETLRQAELRRFHIRFLTNVGPRNVRERRQFDIVDGCDYVEDVTQGTDLDETKLAESVRTPCFWDTTISTEAPFKFRTSSPTLSRTA